MAYFGLILSRVIVKADWQCLVCCIENYEDTCILSSQSSSNGTCPTRVYFNPGFVHQDIYLTYLSLSFISSNSLFLRAKYLMIVSKVYYPFCQFPFFLSSRVWCMASVVWHRNVNCVGSKNACKESAQMSFYRDMLLKQWPCVHVLWKHSLSRATL